MATSFAQSTETGPGLCDGECGLQSFARGSWLHSGRCSRKNAQAVGLRFHMGAERKVLLQKIRGEPYMFGVQEGTPTSTFAANHRFHFVCTAVGQ